MKKLYIGISSYLLQQVRLIHAVSESKYEIVLPRNELEKYYPLKKKFNMNFSIENSSDFDLTDWLLVDHATPKTSIRFLNRPIIFPHAITDYCHSIWGNNRSYQFSFVGLVTETRKEVLDYWMKTHFDNKKHRIIETPKIITNMRYGISKLFGLEHYTKIADGNLLIISSNKGRIFPVKSWDDEYFRILANTKFALCPNGDHVWSYRFFEAILCGAIPVVEQICDAYNGFRFLMMTDKNKLMDWKVEDAEYNFSLCVEKITVPICTLNHELNDVIYNANSTN